jgi:hypothetical protein
MHDGAATIACPINEQVQVSFAAYADVEVVWILSPLGVCIVDSQLHSPP